MPRTVKFRNILLIILLSLFALIGVTWFYYFVIRAPSFSKETAVTIHDSIIQGISGLGSVAIAVIIFRIQSLENRNHSLEQTTLNYISQTMGWSYPEWTASVEEDIKNRTLTNRYYARLPSKTDDSLLQKEIDNRKDLKKL